MVTCINSSNPLIFSNEEYFVLILGGAGIRNNRKELDSACLNSDLWFGVKHPSCGYPNRNKEGWYCIAGGKDQHFKATAIEFYGV